MSQVGRPGRVVFRDLPIGFDGSFGVFAYDGDANALVLRHRGRYPELNDDSEDDGRYDDFVPNCIDVMFTSVRALSIRTLLRDRLRIRLATSGEIASIGDPSGQPGGANCHTYMLEDGDRTGWIVADAVYWLEQEMTWMTPSPMMNQVLRGTGYDGHLYRDRPPAPRPVDSGTGSEPRRV